MDVASLMIKLGVSADTKPLEGVERRLDSLNSKLRLIAGTEVVKAFFHLTEGLGHSSLELMNTAAAAGLTTDAMQRLQFAVAQSGGNAGELGMTMTHLAREIQGAKMGSEEALQVFYQLGISQQQVASFRDTEDALYGVMDALQRIHDPLRRQAMMDRALGQGSRGLGRFALMGKAAAIASGETAKRIGALVPHGTLDRLGEAKASLDALGMMFKAVSSTVGGMFAPVITHVVGQIEKFYTANKAVLLQSFEDWTVEAARAFGVFTAIVEVVGGALLRFIGKNKDLITTGLKVAAAFVGIQTALEGISTAWNGIGALLSFSYWALAATGVAIMAAAVHDLLALMTGAKVEDLWLYKMFTAAGDFFSTGKMGEFFASVMDKTAIGLKNLGVDIGPKVTAAPGVAYPDAEAMQNWYGLQSMQSKPIAGSVSPPLAASGGSSGPVTVTSNNTFNVPAGMTVEQTQQAATAAVRDARVRELEQALVAQRQSFVY